MILRLFAFVHFYNANPHSNYILSTSQKRNFDLLPLVLNEIDTILTTQVIAHNHVL